MTAINDKLKCELERLHVDIPRSFAAVHVAEGQCVDMTGVIEVVTSIDPNVKIIQTFSGALPDTRYALIDGSWNANSFRQPIPVENLNAVREQTPSV